MKNLRFGWLLVAAIGLSGLAACGGAEAETLLTQAEMEAKAAEMFEARKTELTDSMTTVCDENFEAMVTSMKDSIKLAIKEEKKGK